MGCIQRLTAFPQWDPNFKGYKGPLQEEIFVIYNEDGDLCRNSYELDPEQYRSYLDPQTGFIYAYKCYFCIFLAGVRGVGASLVRPFMIVGVELADLVCTRKLEIKKRIINIARAALYSVAMFFCALGTALMPFSTYFWLKLSAVEFAANRGIHRVKSLRSKSDRNTYLLYLTDQPCGHYTQRREDCAKYKYLGLFNYDQIRLKLDSEGKITEGFAVEMQKEGNDYAIYLWNRQLRGDDKKQIETAIHKLVDYVLTYYKCDKAILEVTHITEMGVHFKMDAGNGSGCNLLAYTDDKTDPNNPVNIPLTPDQEKEIRSLNYPFLTIYSGITCESLWLQIKEKITSCP